MDSILTSRTGKMCDSGRLYYCADFGGSSIKLGVIQNDELIVTDKIAAHANLGLRDRLIAVEESWCDMCKESGITNEPSAICLALPSVIEPWGNCIQSVNDKYPDAANVDLDGWGLERFKCPVVVENDANAALAGEWVYMVVRVKGADILC